MRRISVCCLLLSCAPGLARAQQLEPALEQTRTLAPAIADPSPPALSARSAAAQPSRSASPIFDGDMRALMSGLMSSGVLATSVFVHATGPTQWRGGILVDDATRDGLVLPSVRARSVAATVSDGLLLGLAAFPVLVDALTRWLVQGDDEGARRMLLVDLQAHAFAQGITALLKISVRRERPLARGCREDPQRQNDPACQDDVHIAPESFFSGHTSLAFTSAALVCFHRSENSLFGSTGDAAACATSMAFASTVGLLRVMSDRHYASDVLLGAGVGLLSGLVMPHLFSLDIFQIGSVTGPVNATLAPMIDEERVGIQVFGGF